MEGVADSDVSVPVHPPLLQVVVRILAAPRFYLALGIVPRVVRIDVSIGLIDAGSACGLLILCAQGPVGTPGNRPEVTVDT